MLSVQVAHLRNGDDGIVVAAVGNLTNCTGDDLRRLLHSLIEQKPVAIFLSISAGSTQ
jgi:hypothetical protein